MTKNNSFIKKGSPGHTSRFRAAIIRVFDDGRRPPALVVNFDSIEISEPMLADAHVIAYEL
uniref:Uncharacterized protein n=1 Tax=Romanomermis culicivorax TaxID=13658 RepID=A0A915L6N8_ROMCU